MTSPLRFLTLLSRLALVLLLLVPGPVVLAQSPTPSVPESPGDVPDKNPEDAFLDAQVDALMERMTEADIVGQLFVVTFEGNDVTLVSDIVELIHAYRIGGVVLSPERGNFSNRKNVDTAQDVAVLANQLQAAAYGLLLPKDRALAPIPVAPWPPTGDLQKLASLSQKAANNIPLLIGVEQGGDNLPATSLRRGFTPLPSQMSIGAAWDPALAKNVGRVVGQELSTVGINMLLGPNLDVFDQPSMDQAGALSSFSFGGDPFWVSQLGRAYIAGVHEGSEGNVATVVRHFPGQGNTDRLPDTEIATIQRGQDEMRRFALPPFNAVTRQPSSIVSVEGDSSSTDIMMTSHMWYSGLQGGMADRGAPLSLAPELRTILTQEGFSAWHEGTGIIMSGPLGVPAIRNFYSATAPDFYSRRAALEAFTAGNDLLYLADYSLDDDWKSAMANIRETIGFFQTKYVNDAEFRGRVDAAVRRILRLKLGLYRDSLGQDADLISGTPRLEGTSLAPVIPLANVMTNSAALDRLLGTSTEAESIVNDVAREAATILYPDPSTQTEAIPPAFNAEDRILIFSDARLMTECQDCPAEAAIGPDEIEEIIKRLYGSDATGQIDAELVESLTFSQLTDFLDSRLPAADPDAADVATTATITPAIAVSTEITADLASIGSDIDGVGTATEGFEDPLAKTGRLIDEADWIIFAMLDVAPEVHVGSNAVRRFLREYGKEVPGKELVVFGLNAPYFLGATEMSQLTTYFGIYGKTQPFLESAVRALFRGITATGAPPVSVPGTRFGSLADLLQPNPERTLPLRITDQDGKLIAQNNESAASGQDTEEGSQVAAGSTLRVTVGQILDRNGNPVPDGTQVNFTLQLEGEELALAVDPAVTRGGSASRDVLVDRGGTLRVAATAGGASTGQPIALLVAPPPGGPTREPEVAGTATAPNTDVAQATVEEGQATWPYRVSVLTLLIALGTILITLSLLLIVQIRVLPRSTLVHNLLWAAIFGLFGYIMYGLGWFPGGDWLYKNVTHWGTPVVVFVPMLFPLLWLQLRSSDR